MTQQQTTRRVRSWTTVSTDVEVHVDDVAEMMKANGWTPPGNAADDGDEIIVMTTEEAAEINTVRDILLAHHDAEHGITDWPTCRATPCVSLPIIYRERAI